MDVCSAQPLPGYDEALECILSTTWQTDVQSVELAHAAKRVLRNRVIADRDQPPFNRSAMDGFAVRAEMVNANKQWPIAGSVKAGADPSTFQNEMPADAVMRIATGAPVPKGADSVIPIELADADEPGDAVTFHDVPCKAGQNIHPKAADCEVGETVIEAGTLLGAQHIGIAASVGQVKLSVAAQPRVTLLTTGDEVQPSDTATADLGPQQIRNSNGPMLTCLIHAMGGELVEHIHVEDEPDPTRIAAEKALAQSDIVVTVGGVSVGQRDWLPQTWDDIGCAKLLHGIAIQPGKPVLFATCEKDGRKTLILGLPGNPVSALATAHLFLQPIIDSMLGSNCLGTRWREVHLDAEVKAKSARQVFRAAELLPHSRAQVIHWQGSGDLVHTSTADGMVRLPLTDKPVKAGTLLPFLPYVI